MNLGHIPKSIMQKYSKQKYAFAIGTLVLSIVLGGVYANMNAQPRRSSSIPMIKVQPGAYYKLRYGWESDKYLVAKVKITKPYYLGKTEVTIGQWKEVMGSVKESDYFNNGADSIPMRMVSYNEVLEFIAKLNSMQSEHTYRLPTSAEWELVARGRATDPMSQNRYFWGDAPDGSYYWDYESSQETLKPVGTRKVSPEGFADLWGNLFEWTSDRRGNPKAYDYHMGQGSLCTDEYQSKYCYPEGYTETNPNGESDGERRVIVGGSYDSSIGWGEGSITSYPEDFKWYSVGFRLAADE